MQTIDQALALYFHRVDGKIQPKKYVHDWREHLPKGSRWNPGDPGNPLCTQCDGTGYVRLDLPLGHPAFGKIFLCSCVAGMAQT